MSDELTYDEVIDRLPAYTLGALEPEEMLAVDDYIHKHEALLTRLQESEQAAVQLAYLAPTAPLPADGKVRLMQRVQAELRPEQARQPEAKPAPDLASASKPQLRPESLERPQPRPEGGWLADLRTAWSRPNGWAWAAGISLVILLIVGVYTSRIQGDLQQTRAERNSFQAEAIQLQTQLDQVETERDSLQAEVTRLQTDNVQLQQINQELSQQLQTEQGRLDFIANVSPDRTILLPGTAEAPEASGLFYLGQNDQALLLLNNLTPLSAQQTYQLWLIPADRAPIPAGLLAVQSDAPTWLNIQIPPEAQSFAHVGVSKEPAGGSLTPTGPIVLLGAVG